MEVRHHAQRQVDVSPSACGRLVTPAGERKVIWQVPEEMPLAVLLNGSSFAVMMGTPADLEDFAVGFALTEGIVADAAQIESLRIAEAADGFLLNLRVDPARVAAMEERRRSLPGRSGCGICGAQTIAAALPRPRWTSGKAPSYEALESAFAALPGAQIMNHRNRSTHAAAFCRGNGAIVDIREDIGRHNALDKLAGALARSVPSRDVSSGFVLLSSRVSVEMVQKAAAIGVPFLAAISAPSALALRMAARAGMGVAGCSREGIMIFDTGTSGENVA